jgi:hypothetical protein
VSDRDNANAARGLSAWAMAREDAEALLILASVFIAGMAVGVIVTVTVGLL